MKRQIIQIDRDKCNGCGLCVSACQEGALQLIDGKATLVRDDYCDGLGNCLPACPVDAISFVEREALPYDHEAVQANMQKAQPKAEPLPCGCPGSHARKIERAAAPVVSAAPSAVPTSQLNQWPVQIQLVPVNAPYFDGAHLLIAADCAAYAHANFHQGFMKNKVTIIGCPKLDDVDYSEKLTEILTHNRIKSVTIVRMEVPCCGGLQRAAMQALQNCGQMIPWSVTTIGTDGGILEDH